MGSMAAGVFFGFTCFSKIGSRKNESRILRCNRLVAVEMGLGKSIFRGEAAAGRFNLSPARILDDNELWSVQL